jgi:hypothetical protein
VSDVAMITSALAEKLGLTVKPGGLQGVVDGAPFEVRLSAQSQNPHGNVAVLDLQSGTVRPIHSTIDLVVDAKLPFAPPLGAGLQVGPLGGWGALASAGRQGFDARFAVKGDEADRIEVLFGSAARAALDRCFVGDPGPAVRDTGVTFGWRRSPWPTVDEIAAALTPLAEVWRSVREAGRTVRPITGTEEAMVLLAGVPLPAGLELVGAPSGIVGAVDGVGVGVTVAPATAAGWHLRVNLQLETLLPGGPKVVREDRFGWFDRLGALLSGRSEIELGDKGFDRRFAVRSLKPDALREVLDAEVRAAMLALDGFLPIELSGGSIAGHGRVPTGKLEAAAAAALALAAALGR